jgi:hypothetical protein
VVGADEGQAAQRGQLQVRHRGKRDGGKNWPHNQKKKKSPGAGSAGGGGKDDRATCHNCGKKGHWVKECYAPRKEQANLTCVDNEESLLMARVCEIEVDPAPKLPDGGIHLHEPMTHVFLGTGGCDDDTDPLEGWYLDIGASSHMTGRADSFSLLDHAVQGTVRFGDGSVVPIEGRGIVTFLNKIGEKIKLANVLYIPQLKSIISLGQLDERGCIVQIQAGVLRVWDHRQRLLIKIRRGTSRLYVMQINVFRGVCLGVRHDEGEDERWHARYGHIGYDALCLLSRQDMVTGLPAIEEKQDCDTCIITKQRQASFPAKVNYRADAPLDLVHGDLCGPITPATSAGRHFFLLLVDDITRYMWLTLLSVKGDAVSAIKAVKAAAELEVGQPLRVLRTDNGGEFTMKEFTQYCSNEGV